MHFMNHTSLEAMAEKPPIYISEACGQSAFVWSGHSFLLDGSADDFEMESTDGGEQQQQQHGPKPAWGLNVPFDDQNNKYIFARRRQG